MTPPVKFAPTQDEFSLMNTADNNNDKICWTWNEERQEFYSRYTTNIDMDDYLFLPAMKFGTAPRKSMNSPWMPLRGRPTSRMSSSKLSSPLHLTTTALSRALWKQLKVPCAYDLRGNLISEYKNFQTAFNVIEPGIYYIGIHCSSEGRPGRHTRKEHQSLRWRCDSPPARQPQKVSRTTPGENGALQATVSITFPTAYVSTVIPIAEGTELTATVESTVDKVTVKASPADPPEAVVKTVQGKMK